MQKIGRKDASEANAPQETAESRAEEAGPVVTEAEIAPLKEALRGLLAEGLPAGTVDGTRSRLLGRLQVGVEQLRTNKQLAPWMHGVVCRVIEESGEPGPRPASLTAGDPGGQDRIAGALVPLLDPIEPEHAEVLRLTDHGTLTQRAAAARLGIPLVALKSRIHVARRKLRLVVLAGLKLLAPDTTDDTESTPVDTRAPRRRIPASRLLPAFTAGLEQLVRPWVSRDQAPATTASVLTGLCAALGDQPHNGRMPGWLYATTRAIVLAGNTGTPISTLPSSATAEARSILAPAMQALLADVDADQLTALTLVDLEGRSQRDAARHLGILPETFKQRLWRARRLGWQSLARALTASRQPAPAPTHVTALLDALQTLIQHLAPTIPPNPALQRLLRQLHADAPTQRPSSSVVDFLYSAAISSLQPTPRYALPTPPADPGPTERAALADCLAPLLATLTPEQSEALTLIDFDGLSLNAAAAQVGTDRPTFQGRLQRARIRLRQLLTACLSVPHPSREAA